MMVKREKIRVGDKVKVINPFVFERCGYPLCVNDMDASVEDYEENTLLEMLGAQDYDSLSFYGKKAFDAMKKGFMLYLLAEKSFGGPQRTIHTHLDEAIKNKIATVTSIKKVVTGTRIEGNYLDDYPHLTNSKVYKILTVKDGFWNFQIPEYNVTKIT